jgi:hypothetical protein
MKAIFCLLKVQWNQEIQLHQPVFSLAVVFQVNVLQMYCLQNSHIITTSRLLMQLLPVTPVLVKDSFIHSFIYFHLMDPIIAP